MSKIMISLIFVAFIALAACVGIRAPQVRGVAQSADASTAFASGVLASNSLPAMAVLPSEGFQSVASGVLDAGVSRDRGLSAAESARVWYALHSAANGQKQVVASLAELSSNDWIWSINPLHTDRRALEVLRQVEIPRYGVSWTVFTYVRPAAKDPWMSAFAEQGQGWDGDVLVRQFNWWATGHKSKVVIEYREPVPGAYFGDEPAPVREFEERADKAFVVLRKEMGDELPARIEKARTNTAHINGRMVGALLGELAPGMRSLGDDL